MSKTYIIFTGKEKGVHIGQTRQVTKDTGETFDYGDLFTNDVFTPITIDLGTRYRNCVFVQQFGDKVFSA